MVERKQPLFSLEEQLTPRVALWAHIAIGVCLGIVGAVGILGVTAALVFNVWNANANETMRRSYEQLRQSKAEAARAASLAETQRQQDREAAQRADDAAKARKLAEEERRELAWARYYKKPAACDEARGGSWTVDCANDYMRARAKFGELFESGNL